MSELSDKDNEIISNLYDSIMHIIITIKNIIQTVQTIGPNKISEEDLHLIAKRVEKFWLFFRLGDKELYEGKLVCFTPEIFLPSIDFLFLLRAYKFSGIGRIACFSGVVFNENFTHIRWSIGYDVYQDADVLMIDVPLENYFNESL